MVAFFRNSFNGGGGASLVFADAFDRTSLGVDNSDVDIVVYSLDSQVEVVGQFAIEIGHVGVFITIGGCVGFTVPFIHTACGYFDGGLFTIQDSEVEDVDDVVVLIDKLIFTALSIEHVGDFPEVLFASGHIGGIDLRLGNCVAVDGVVGDNASIEIATTVAAFTCCNDNTIVAGDSPAILCGVVGTCKHEVEVAAVADIEGECFRTTTGQCE